MATFGHAVEAASSFSISHGCAVSIGMVMMTRAAVKKGYCKEEVLEKLIALLKNITSRRRFPTPASALLDIVKSDKKRWAARSRSSSPKRIGRCTLVPIPTTDVLDWLTAGGAE